MNAIKVLGALLIFIAGYLLHIIIISDWTLRGKIYIFLIVLLLVHLGLAGVLIRNNKSFKENVLDALAWPFTLLP